jgi:hypothetical protein
MNDDPILEKNDDPIVSEINDPEINDPMLAENEGCVRSNLIFLIFYLEPKTKKRKTIAPNLRKSSRNKKKTY